jgi:hypothetical protein
MIEGSYSVVGETVRSPREPIFNDWHNAIPLLIKLTLRGLWKLASAGRLIGTIILSLFFLSLVATPFRNFRLKALKAQGAQSRAESNQGA